MNQAARREMERFFGTELIIPTGSGTSALLLALRALNASGRDVLVPELVCPNVAVAIYAAGARQVPVPPSADTYNLSADAVRPLLGPSVAAIIAVDSFGYPADVEALRRVAAPFGCAVIEDACQAYGGTVRDEIVGTRGDLGVVSFGVAKPASVGGGGALLVDTPERFREIRAMMRTPLPYSMLKKRLSQHLMRVGRHGMFRFFAMRFGLLRFQFPEQSAARLPEALARIAAERDEIRANLRLVAELVSQFPSSERFAYEGDGWLPWRYSFKAQNAAGLRSNLRAAGIPTSQLYRPLVEYFPDVAATGATDVGVLAERTVNLVYQTTIADTARLHDALRTFVDRSADWGSPERFQDDVA